eukprot:GEMP01053501.1.p1 GENE.GEMP01053501.1~~GEMP01053501.1.p1  ORF type:complete len:367 (+),score=100.88 GEMP01053501.1:54-1154(+)
MEYDDEDDIAEFEKRCFGDPHVNYLAGDDPGSSSEEDVQISKARALEAPQNAQHWRDKVQMLESRLTEKDQKISQLRDDLSLVDSGTQPHEGIVGDLKSKLVDLAKKNRRMLVTIETQKTKIDALDKQHSGGGKREVSNVEPSRQDFEDFKQKYLQSSNKLQEVRHEMQELKAQLHKQKKVLLKELGAQEDVDKALACADDPFSLQWQGRAAIVAQLQRQLKETRGDDCKQTSTSEPPKRVQQGISAAADQRRREFDELQARCTAMEEENHQLKRQRDGYKSRIQNLEKTVKDMKGHIQMLIEKSENDDTLLAQRHPPEAEAQIVRQAKIIESLQQQLRAVSGGDQAIQQPGRRSKAASAASCAPR